MRASARSCTWIATPLGTFQSYGQTMPTLIARPPVPVGGPHRLQHVPVAAVVTGGVAHDVGPLLGEIANGVPDPWLGRGQRRPELQPGVVVVVVRDDGQQHRVGAERQQGWASRQPSGLAEQARPRARRHRGRDRRAGPPAHRPCSRSCST